MATILIVEDSKLTAKFIGAIVEGLGHDFNIAENGEIAVELFQKNVYGTILMDLMMPVMDGFESTKTMRMLTDRPKVPIIAVTANTEIGIRLQCLKAGMDDYIPKPFKAEGLQEKLDYWLNYQEYI
ncbi:MAG: CheY-like chemotaxis protein [bacterium]|jgi:CheY-like chemotaxis protein